MKNFVFIIALAFLSATAFGQRVNFSGDWTLNEDKSELGYEFSLAPKSMTLDHTKKTFDQTIVSEWDGQEYESKNHYTLDGEVCENPGWEGTVTKSTAVYDKKAKNLKIVTDGEVQGMGYTLTQVFSMKDDNLIVESEAASDMGEMVETFVFDKK
ncbi:MAG: hypothetical protein U9R60_04625 [Bacteroidota bacterium]|nr:hypothetical protein [Bacteroidota bacterium]